MTRRVENAVILTGSDCALLYEAARLRDLRVKARGASDRLYALLTDITAATFAHQASAKGTKPQVSTETSESRRAEIVTVEAVARQAGITPRAVRNHIEAGLLDAQKINRVWIIPTNAAKQYIAGRNAE